MDSREACFKSTRWTTVLRAGQPGASGADLALARLCEDYRPPLYQFARTWLISPDDAEDLTQSFFFHFIRKNLPGAVSRERGRFRTFLLACFKNFLRDEWRRQKRAREIPAELLRSLHAGDEDESTTMEPAVAPSLDHELDALWAKSIQQRVILALEEDYEKRGKKALFDSLLPLITGHKPDQSYSELAITLGISKESLKVEAMRLRERFRDRFRDEVEQTVGNSQEREAEYRYLLKLLFLGVEAT